eukprot:Opistho-2@43755
MRVRSMTFYWSGGLMDKISPYQFLGISVIVNIVFSDTSFAILFNVLHGFLYAFMESIKDVMVFGKGMQDGNGFGAMKINVIACRPFLSFSGGHRSTIRWIHVLTESKKRLLGGNTVNP